MVNIVGVLGLGVLTTNVTGHFAYFSEAVQKHDLIYAFNFLYFIISFLIGAFVSNCLTEYFTLRNSRNTHHAAVFLELGFLIAIGALGDGVISTGHHKELLACLLLFSMGAQNALVTKISGANVRTTHLTGLFTDFGIELSQLIFYKEKREAAQLKKNIGLRSGIIFFFFLGCIAGGYLYSILTLKTLLVASVVLIIALIYDTVRVIYLKKIKTIRHGISE
jgi:uncharacterized membrane protein YoaK (UPF0700 family)